MIFSQAPEMTTAVTDVILGIFAFWFSYKLGFKKENLRTRLWQYVLIGTGASAVLGFPAHAVHSIAGLNPPDLRAQTIYWVFLGFFLFFMITLLGITALTDFFGEKNFCIINVLMSSMGLFFYFAYFIVAVMEVISGYFIVFIIYSALIMLIALIIYFLLFVKTKERGYLFIITAILISVIANLVQATRSVSFTLVSEFDYNSVYHFIMILSVFFFYRGVKQLEQ